VRERGRGMAEAASRTATGMSAVLGGDREEVLAKLEEHGLTAANDNGPGQLVAAGTKEQLDALEQDPPEKARVKALPVAGAFHTEHMGSAVDTLAGFARAISTHDPRTRLLSNRDGQVVHHGHEVLDRLVNQVRNPVRWDLCMQTMTDLGVTGMIELPPSGTLTGIAKRGMKGVETFALETPDQLDEARAFVDKHGTASPLDTTATWRLLVAPAKGTFHNSDRPDVGSNLDPGAAVGEVYSLRDALPVVAPHGGEIVEWLVEDGDLVSPGQPLVRLQPEGQSS
jgi:[acyl-carrier-protein] S-malonyltransferase